MSTQSYIIIDIELCIFINTASIYMFMRILQEQNTKYIKHMCVCVYVCVCVRERERERERENERVY